MQPAQKTSGSSSRITFIDVMRGLAALLMIAVHTTDAFLAVPFREGWLWSQINILFGFVAPAFLLFSGVTLYLAVERRKASGRSLSDLFPRAILILALGYWLHIPSHSLRLSLEATPLQRFTFFDSDILHVIALSILFVLVLVMFVRVLRVVSWVILGVAVIIAAITPVLWNASSVESIPLAFHSFFAPPGSFPLFPYAAYVLIGFYGAAMLVQARTHRYGPPVVTAVGVGMILVGYLLQLILLSAPPFDNFWHGSPALLLFRLGGILLITGGVMWLEVLGTRMTWLGRIGRASLAIYVLHLVLVYGSPVTKGMQYWFDGMLRHALNPLQTLALLLAVTVVTLFAVDLWRRFRDRYPVWGKRLAWGWWIGFTVVFLATGWF